MRKVSWLIVGINLLLIIALMGCGYAKKDEVDKQLADQKMETDQKIQLAQDAATKAGEDAAKALSTAREEIGIAKAEAIAAAEGKDAEVMVAMKSSMEAGDAEVKRSAEEAAAKALADAKASAIAEDEKVKQTAKAAADKAMSAAEEADRKAAAAAREAEVAKTLPEPKEPIVISVYFGLGQATVRKEDMPELEKAAELIKANPGAVVKVEGHTDNTPVIRSTQFKNNWGLSQARARAVTKHLVEKLGVPADAIKETLGYAFYKPVSSNTGKDQSKNRRVDVVIMK